MFECRTQNQPDHRSDYIYLTIYLTIYQPDHSWALTLYIDRIFYRLKKQKTVTLSEKKSFRVFSTYNK